ncbi:hypothetical protein M885DRAFT_578001 [Pelagophyceae sp. CCMP2097]|nr:hypothetical protein M885DRAFT_578001 [Pelagophyceae sp. CCMP2097]
MVHVGGVVDLTGTSDDEGRSEEAIFDAQPVSSGFGAKALTTGTPPASFPELPAHAADEEIWVQRPCDDDDHGDLLDVDGDEAGHTSASFSESFLAGGSAIAKTCATRGKCKRVDSSEDEDGEGDDDSRDLASAGTMAAGNATAAAGFDTRAPANVADERPANVAGERPASVAGERRERAPGERRGRAPRTWA